jgi:uncharacterized membrane protein YcaP (DUF421 family)
MEETTFLWNGFQPLLRIFVVGVSAYVAIVLILRISGKRTLASMSAFDFVIAVAVGAVFARTLTTKNLSISETITAFVLLAILQFVFASLEGRSKMFRRIFSASPRLLYYNGEFLEKNLRKERLDRSKVIGAARKRGYGSMDDVAAVILEIDASFSVIGKSKAGENSTFKEYLEEG